MLRKIFVVVNSKRKKSQYVLVQFGNVPVSVDTSLLFSFTDGAYIADWCTVQGSCGEWSLYHGYWDYCQYKAESQPGFSLSWRQKHDNLWNQIKDDPTLGQYNVKKMLTQAIKYQDLF